MNRNLRIEGQTYDYLGFLYRVRVTPDRSVCWELWTPEAREVDVAHCGTIRAQRVRRNPHKAVAKAHKDARKWINSWLNTHFALETAMGKFADDYAINRTEFPPGRQAKHFAHHRSPE